MDSLAGSTVPMWRRVLAFVLTSCHISYGWETLRSSLAPKPPKCVSCPTTWIIKSQQVWCGFWQISSNAKKNNAFPIPYTPWCWYSYLHNWVILFRQMLVNIPAPWSIWYGYIWVWFPEMCDFNIQRCPNWLFSINWAKEMLLGSPILGKRSTC